MNAHFLPRTIALAIACLAPASAAWAVDLLQVYRDAVANDPVIASARSQLQANQEKIIQGRSGLLPAVNLSGNYNKSEIDGSTSTSPTPINRNVTTNGYSVALTQPLFRWANWETFEQSKLVQAQAEATYAQAQIDLITRVSQAYFDVLNAQDTLTVQEAQIKAIGEQLAQAKRNFEVGTSTIVDVNDAQARYDLAIATQIAAQNDLQVKRNALLQIIGKEPGNLASLKNGVTIQAPTPARMDDWTQIAEKQNYSVVQQQFGYEIAKRTTTINKAGHYPTVDFVASRGRTNSEGSTQLQVAGNSTSNINTTQYGIQVAIPLFAGFATQSKVRESLALEDKSLADLDNVRRTAVQSTRQAFLGVNNGLAQVRALEASERSSQTALESNQLGFQVGVKISIDVLNSQQQLFTTRRDLAKARYDALMNGLKLKAAAGVLKEEDLAEVNALLDK